jgi:predicted membrane-bound mannosyltransferase
MNQNNANMRTLQVGMTEEQVIAAMGPSPDRSTPNPYRSEMYPAGGAVFKVLFFYTNRQSADGIIDDDELTPVVLKDGHLDGWGWSYWQTTAARYDLRIRVR